MQSEQNRIGLVRFCSIGSKIELTAKKMFDFVRLLIPIECDDRFFYPSDGDMETGLDG